jgi:hypothetical protein
MAWGRRRGHGTIVAASTVSGQGCKRLKSDPRRTVCAAPNRSSDWLVDAAQRTHRYLLADRHRSRLGVSGTNGSNPLSSSGESEANSVHGGGTSRERGPREPKLRTLPFLENSRRVGHGAAREGDGNSLIIPQNKVETVPQRRN